MESWLRETLDAAGKGQAGLEYSWGSWSPWGAASLGAG